MPLAEDSFRRALALNPRDGDVAHNYGWLLCQQARYRESFQLFAQAVASPAYGGQAKSFMAQGVCQVRAGQRLDAEQSLSRAYQLDAGNPVIGYNLASLLYDEVKATDELEPFMNHLSITTFRYIPSGMDSHDTTNQEYLNQINQKILNRLQHEGEAFVSNAVIDGKYLLRTCIVNFRTREEHVKLLPSIVVRIGREVHSQAISGN